VFPIEIPPLRERREDIPLLVNYFVSKLARRMGKEINSVPRHVMEFLANNDWKGNIRELANFVERAVILTHREELEIPKTAPHTFLGPHPVTEALGSFGRNLECGLRPEYQKATEAPAAVAGSRAVLKTRLNLSSSLGVQGWEHKHSRQYSALMNAVFI
jgi:DNA-binding NtrC family response regulator